MADEKISELDAKATVHDTDLIPTVDIEAAPDKTKYVTGANFKAQMIAGHVAAPDPHTVYIKHSLATAVSNFLVASGAGVFIKKTLAEVKTLLGIAADIATHAALATGVHGLKGEVGFSAYQTSVQSITPDTETQVEWHAEQWDVGGYFDLANNRFLPLIAGKYFIEAGLQMTSLVDGTGMMVLVRKNGGLYKIIVRTYTGSLSSPIACGGCIVDLNGSTDYVDLAVRHWDSAARDTGGAAHSTWCQGFLIAQT